MTITFTKPAEFIGRNGLFTAGGLDVILDTSSDIIALQPKTRQDKFANCIIEIPTADIPTFIAALQKVTPKQNEQKSS